MRQNAATRRNMRREERVTVQGPVKKQQPDGMSHRGGVGPLFQTPPPPELAGLGIRAIPAFCERPPPPSVSPKCGAMQTHGG